MADLSDDEAAILAVIHGSRIAVWMRDFEAYQKCYVHAPYTTRWNASPVSGITVSTGWDEIADKVRQGIASYAGSPDFSASVAHANAYATEILDLKIRISGDMAWATYRQAYPATTAPRGVVPSRAWHHASPSPTHEVRVLERQGGEWRIAFIGFLDPGSGRSASALLQLAPDGTVEWQSDAAAEALAGEDDLVIRNGRLRVRDTSTDARLQAAIKWAATLSAPIMPGRGSLPIAMEAGDGLPTKVWWVIAESGKIFFSLGDPGRDEQRLDAAAIVYGLSRAQRQVAGHIVAGHTLAETAEHMGITVNTARTHLDRVFEKTGVRTQPALVRALLSVAAPI